MITGLLRRWQDVYKRQQYRGADDVITEIELDHYFHQCIAFGFVAVSYTHLDVYKRQRRHSPQVDHEGNIYIVESKSIAAYLRQLQALGERVEDYSSCLLYTSRCV